MAGCFNTEGTFTKNTVDEVKEMMNQLETWSSVETRPSAEECARRLAATLPLVAASTPIDIHGFMGDWFVLANIPTPLEVGTANNIEHYDWDADRKCVQVTFSYSAAGSTEKSFAYMRGYIKNEPVNTRWSLDVKLGFYLPLGLTYLIPYIAEDNSYVIVSVPDRSYLWIMTRGRPLPADAAKPDAASAKGVQYLSQEEQDTIYETAVKKAVDLGFNKDKIVRPKWTTL